MKKVFFLLLLGAISSILLFKSFWQYITDDRFDETKISYWEIRITKADGTVRWQLIAESDREPEIHPTESGRCQIDI